MRKCSPRAQHPASHVVSAQEVLAPNVNIKLTWKNPRLSFQTPAPFDPIQVPLALSSLPCPSGISHSQISVSREDGLVLFDLFGFVYISLSQNMAARALRFSSKIQLNLHQKQGQRKGARYSLPRSEGVVEGKEEKQGLRGQEARETKEFPLPNKPLVAF